MDYTEYHFDYTPEQHDFYFALFSDLHLDAPGFRADLFKADADRAQTLNARFLFNGDIFDAIFPRDHKRYHRAGDTSREDAQVNDKLHKAVSILKPYVDSIDFIGYGNHEVSALKYNNVDLIELLVSELQHYRSAELPPIRRGSYQGFLRFWFRSSGIGATRQYVIYREHGKGGASPVTHGVINFSRLFTTFIADCYWVGHTHSGLVDTSAWTIWLDRSGNIRKRRKLAIITAGYNEGFIQRNLTSGKEYRSSFPEEAFLVPTSLGSVLLHLTIPRSHEADIEANTIVQA